MSMTFDKIDDNSLQCSVQRTVSIHLLMCRYNEFLVRFMRHQNQYSSKKSDF